MNPNLSLCNRSLDDLSYVTVDLETTGVLKDDRICEVAVVRMLDDSPELVLETTVNPQKPVGASEAIHQLSDTFLADSPLFDEVEDCVRIALSGHVVVAHNAPFDIPFISRALGVEPPPMICTQEVNNLLIQNGSEKLVNVAAWYGIDYDIDGVHSAAGDAKIAARVWASQIKDLRKVGITTFGELWRAIRHKTIRQASRNPYIEAGDNIPDLSVLRPRVESPVMNHPLERYFDIVSAALLSNAAPNTVITVQKRLKLTHNEIRFVHIQVLHASLSQFIEAPTAQVEEEKRLKKISSQLRAYTPFEGLRWLAA